MTSKALEAAALALVKATARQGMNEDPAMPQAMREQIQAAIERGLV